MATGYNVSIVGATGLVGREMLKVLDESSISVDRLTLLASERSSGEVLDFRGEKFLVEVLTKNSFKGCEIALFSAGKAVARTFAPIAARGGTIVVDNSSEFRLFEDIPLIVPEVNLSALPKKPRIIANPNCSTIQLVLALKPLHDFAGIKRVVVSTYQSVSGAGKKAIDELLDQVKDILSFRPQTVEVFPHQIAFNVIPHIDFFHDNNSTNEEYKMVAETRKILGEPSLRITATTVRVPTVIGHGESVNIEFENPITVEQAKDLLGNAPGIKVLDSPSSNTYPLPIDVVGTNDVYVGRIRIDDTVPSGLNLWIVADNLRKGAALNAVQIAEALISKSLLGERS